MEQTIESVIRALNEIEVKGERNLNLLLASIQTLTGLLTEGKDESHTE